MGAAAAVLNAGSRAAPLVLTASKSWIGHSEPAAGVVGLTHASVALTRSLQLPILHLGPVNPYVEALMDRQPDAWAAPRQPAALAAGGMAASVSAFAFQGTNAHAVLGPAHAGVADVPAMPAGPAWTHQQRHWVAPAANRCGRGCGWKAVPCCGLAPACTRDLLASIQRLYS